MKLNRIEGIAFDKSKDIFNRRINHDCDPRNFRWQCPDPIFLATQVKETLRPRVEVEPKSIRVTRDCGLCFGLVSDAANFHVDAPEWISKEPLHVQRVTYHGLIICCDTFHRLDKNPGFFPFTASRFELICARLPKRKSLTK